MFSSESAITLLFERRSVPPHGFNAGSSVVVAVPIAFTLERMASKRRRLRHAESKAIIDTDMHLRNATPEDEGEIHRLFCIPEVFEYLADGKEPPPSIASEWVKCAAADLSKYGGGLWVLVDGADPRVGGLVRLAGDESGGLELTCLLHPSLWGLGFATRMSHTAMKQAFGAGLVSTIWAGADAPNRASFAVMKRLGMQFRREVQYPMGVGMEYQIRAGEFDPRRIEPLPIA